MTNKVDPARFFSHPDNLALSAAASGIFGLLKRSVDLPASWAALVTRETGDDALVRPGGIVESADADQVLFVRVSPVDLTIDEDNIVTRDKYPCRAGVCLRVSATAEPGELRSFRKTILGSQSAVRADALARYLQPTVRAALSRLAAEHEAAALVETGSPELVSAALVEALKGPCFAAGLIVEGAPITRFDSPALRQVQQFERETARRRAEHELGRGLQEALERAQARHLDHLASLLARLNELASASPEVELPELLRTFSEHQRGELYEALFALEAPAAQTRWIVVAAGEELLFFDPHSLDSPRRRLTIAGDAGPVRSVQTVRDRDGAAVLLLGAATGVYRLPADCTEPDLTLRVPQPRAVRGGFNAVALVRDRVLASHSELGLCEWSVSEPAAPRSRFASLTAGAQVVRNVRFADGYLYCSIDDRVIRWPADDTTDRPTYTYTGSAATISALCATSYGVFAGNSDGDVLHWPPGRSSEPERLHRGSNRAAESVCLLMAHGVRRLVYTDTSLSVYVRVLGDNFTCRYEAGGQTLRRAAVAPDLIAAVNDLRDRLFCWTAGQPAKPRATIGIAGICGHSLQDVCLVPQVP